MIYLYDSTTTDFTYNGHPLPKAYEVTVDKMLNDEFFVTGKHPLDKAQKYKLLQKDKIIKVHTADGMQPFRIMNISKGLGYVEFEAWPLLYADLRNKLIKPFILKGANGQSALTAFVNNLLLDTRFEFNSNILDTHDFTVQDETDSEQNPNQLYEALEVLKRIVNRWGGELIIDGFDIRMVSRIGKDTDALLYEKKNISNFVDQESIQGIVTRVHGISEWTETDDDGEQIEHSIKATVDSPLINAYSGIVFEKQYTNNDVRSEQELKNWLNLKFTTEDIDKPTRSIELDTNIIDDTEIALGDKLNLKYLKHDVDMQIRVVRYQYDGFFNRYTKIYVGDVQEHFTGSVQNSITTAETNVKSSVDKTIANVIINRLGEKIVYSEHEPSGEFSQGDVWFDTVGGMYFWDEASANWLPHPFNRRVDVVEKQVDEAVAEIKKVEQSANDAVAKADTAIQEAGFAKVDASAAVVNAATALNTAQTAAADASTALTNAGTALDRVGAVETTTSNLTTYYNELTQTVGAKADKAVVDGINQTVTTHSSQIETNAEGLLAKADKSLVDTLKGTVDSHSSQIQLNAEGLGFKADKTLVDTINQTVANHTNEISTNAQAINARLTETQINTLLNGKNYVNQTTLNATASGLSGQITQVSTDLSSLEIGGRNLILGSNNPLTPSGNSTGISASTTSEGFYQIIASTGNGNWFYFKQLYDLRFNKQIEDNFKVGDKLTFSIDIKSPDSTDVPTLYVYGANNRYDSLVGSMSSDFSRFYLTVEFTSDFTNRINLAMGISDGSGTFIFRNPKLEKGNKATDWTPAPEDMATLEKVVSLEANINGLQTTVANKAEQSQVTQLAGQVSSKVESATYNSKMTQLDSAINLRVQKGELISQINVQAGRTLISSNKIYLDASSVVFGGSAFIPSAAISSLSADKVNTGTLNAANVNIINLNANAITSGTIDGANSDWNLNTGTMNFRDPSTGDNLKLAQGRIEFQNGAQGRQLLYNAEGLMLRPFSTNTGTSRNTSLHLIGGATGSFQYIQFIEGGSSSITQRLEAEGGNMRALVGPNGEFQVKKYNTLALADVNANAYKTYDAGGDQLTIIKNEIKTPRYGAKNIYLTPQGTGIVKIADTATGSFYNIQASTFLNSSSRKLKTNIMAYNGSALAEICQLQVVTYNLKKDLTDGVVNPQIGFIAEDSPSIASVDGQSIDMYKLGALNARSIQELSIKSDNHETRIKHLEQEIKQLKGAAS